MNYFENQIVNASIENAVIFTATGDIYHCTGKLDGIGEIEKLGDKLKGSIVTHNHPISAEGDYSFSRDDQILFRDFELARLRGIDDRYLYEFDRDSSIVDDDMPDFRTVNRFNYWHGESIKFARKLGIGYWRRER